MYGKDPPKDVIVQILLGKLLHQHLRSYKFSSCFTGLFQLTMFASTEVFFLHATGFCAFFLCSVVTITIISRLMGNGLTGSGTINSNVKFYPLLYCITFLACFLSYLIHNKYCFTGMYTIFGAFEVIMIATNIMFWHHCDVMEWKSYKICIE